VEAFFGVVRRMIDGFFQGVMEKRGGIDSKVRKRDQVRNDYVEFAVLDIKPGPSTPQPTPKIRAQGKIGLLRSG